MIRVLIADDSSLVRAILKDILAGGDITVAAEAANGREAVELTALLRPDLVVMDIVMPVMDGLTAIGEIMTCCPTPILVLSGTLADRDVDLAFAAIKAGALDVMEKPAENLIGSGVSFAEKLRTTVRMLARVKVIRHHQRRRKEPAPPPSSPTGGRPSILAIGASTGGPKAVMSIVKSLPPDFPAAVCIVQHIASGFARGFTQWLDRESSLTVRLAREGDHLTPGEALVAPDDRHMTVVGGTVHLLDTPPVNCCRPSIDPLFCSLAEAHAEEVVGVLLTGMGRDGARGLKQIRERGGMTIVQDEASSVIFGMPRAAIALDAAGRVAALDAIPPLIAELFSQQGG
ncbi:chemotaxis-specific protein-glutamate methyltransferase CheB [Geobacter pickeringii]|uniref:Protein-glutamate methylesterase/protein-glutamine glutaminase n=1 Tax=Geobacter pickeringii TaxID=345632 RepID=A0A0B5BJT8_9BACT|nr:chemotaxis-specific protein-glutamate methyltransferase CheB [Geobacter pickeringii]AJE04760.1 chemotaxis protein CheB [Geobacter pickeringii]